jgi:paraquat-inducible protein B
MKRKPNPILIGGFVLSALALIIIGLMVFGSGRLWTETRSYVLYFSGSVKGLNVGSPVMFRGVTIGAVRDIRVIADPSDLSLRVPVIIEIEPGLIRPATGGPDLTKRDGIDFLKLLVDPGLRAQLQLQSLVTGQLFVQLDFFPESPIRYAGQNETLEEIPTIPSNIEEVSKTLGQIPLDQLALKVVSTLDGIERLVNAPELTASIGNLNESFKAVQELARNVDARMAELVTSVASTMDEVRILARDIDRQVEPVGDRVRMAAVAASQAFQRMESALTRLERTLAEGSPERRDLHQALGEVQDAARAVRGLAEALELQPEMLLKGRQGGKP